MEQKGMRAQSVCVQLADGSVRRMDFDMGMLAAAETVYETRFGRSVNASAVIMELIDQKARAVMAVCFGAMESAGEKITWDDFSKGVYTWENYSALSGAALEGVTHMMSGAQRSADGEGGEKNAPSRGDR